MLRIHFMLHWFNPSDPAMEDSLYDSESMRRLARIELADGRKNSEALQTEVTWDQLEAGARQEG